jgi:hemerythrin-like metal-binding protein
LNWNQVLTAPADEPTGRQLRSGGVGLSMGASQENPFTWSEKYRVGISFADVQHKQLVDIINRLHEALVDGKGRTDVGKVLDDLIRYSRAHFAAEEEVLQSCGYPDFLAHHTEHECLSFAMFEFYQKFMTYEMAMTDDAVEFLKNWLGEEILDADMKFAPFLKGKGVP